jgi:imidazoleglycerol-phosphate dehydratase
MSRKAIVKRATKESSVHVELELDGTGVIEIETGVPFFDHMLNQLGKHGGFDLKVITKGDVEVDSHHTVEDTSLVKHCVKHSAIKLGFADSVMQLCR